MVGRKKGATVGALKLTGENFIVEFTSLWSIEWASLIIEAKRIAPAGCIWAVGIRSIATFRLEPITGTWIIVAVARRHMIFAGITGRYAEVTTPFIGAFHMIVRASFNRWALLIIEGAEWPIMIVADLLTFIAFKRVRT